MKKMIKPLIAGALVFTLTLCPVCADDTEIVSKDLESMADALVNDKPEVIIEMTHPTVLDAAGGKEAHWPR